MSEIIGLSSSIESNGIKTETFAFGIPNPLLTLTLPTMTP